jgi:hypothetical protein
VFVTNREERLFEGTTFDFSQEIRKFLVGSQWRRLLVACAAQAARTASAWPFSLGLFRSTARAAGILAKHPACASHTRHFAVGVAARSPLIPRRHVACARKRGRPSARDADAVCGDARVSCCLMGVFA